MNRSLARKIILVTPGQPALNPRLVKEADALTEAGYHVTVFYAYWNTWGDNFTKSLLASKKWKAICIGGHPVENPFTYFTSKIINATARFIIKICGPVNYFTEIAANRCSFFLLREIKNHNADLYIAHYLGALPAVIKAAQKNNARCGFDAEDFHRQEVNDDQASYNFKVARFLEDSYLNHVDYITASSPQIAQQYQLLYPTKKPVTVLNVFPESNRIKIQNDDAGVIKLFWFSQTIGADRGLENLAAALKQLNTADFELHLLGYIPVNEKQHFLSNVLLGIRGVYFHEPIPPDEVIDFASQFHIGIAAEQSVPFNRDICLTNKVFTYLQAGLAIVASNTTAQKHFMDENPGIGEIYEKNNVESLTVILSNYNLNRALLSNTRAAALKLGIEKYNWQNESKKLLSVIEKTIN
jgi:glycosyltransferase involved in cell wall biosynthesis